MWRAALHGLDPRLRRRSLWGYGFAGLSLGLMVWLLTYDPSPRVERRSLRSWVALAARQENDREVVEKLASLGAAAQPWLVPYLANATNPPGGVRAFLLRAQVPAGLLDWLPAERSTPLERGRVALHVVDRIGSPSATPGLVSTLIPLLEHEALATETLQILLRPAAVSASDLERIAQQLQGNPRSPWHTNHARILWAHGRANPGLFERLAVNTDPGLALLGQAGTHWFAGRIDAALERVDEPWQSEGTDGGREGRRWERRMSFAVLGAIGIEASPLARRWVRRLEVPGDSEVRENAAMGLGRLENSSVPPEAYLALLKCLEPGEDPQVRLAAIETLGRTGTRDKRVEVALEALLQGSDEEVIGTARRALQQLQLTR